QGLLRQPTEWRPVLVPCRSWKPSARYTQRLRETIVRIPAPPGHRRCTELLHLRMADKPRGAWSTSRHEYSLNEPAEDCPKLLTAAVSSFGGTLDFSPAVLFSRGNCAGGEQLIVQNHIE